MSEKNPKSPKIQKEHDRFFSVEARYKKLSEWFITQRTILFCNLKISLHRNCITKAKFQLSTTGYNCLPRWATFPILVTSEIRKHCNSRVLSEVTKNWKVDHFGRQFNQKERSKRAEKRAKWPLFLFVYFSTWQNFVKITMLFLQLSRPCNCSARQKISTCAGIRTWNLSVCTPKR